jgi:hypothetical protein
MSGFSRDAYLGRIFGRLVHVGLESTRECHQAVWAKAEHVHRVEVSARRHMSDLGPPESASGAMASLHRLVSAGLLTARQVVVLGETLDRFWAPLPRTPKVLNHGDLGKVNALDRRECRIAGRF